MKRILTISLFLVFTTYSSFCQIDSFVEKTKSYLDDLSKDEYFSLSITISKDDQILFTNAYGYADRSHEVLNDVNTKFNIASIGKMFTAVSILKLREDYQFDLHQAIGYYLPDFPNEYIRDSISAHQLLTHTSGLPLWFNDEFDQSPKFKYSELADYLKLYEGIEVDKSKVGKRSYSNVGFITLGYLIEALSGKSYKAYLNEHIFQVLKMDGTNIWKLTEIIPNAAIGYVRPSSKDDSWKTNYYINKSSSPAGGAYSTTGDLIKFFDGLINNQLISEASKQLMFSPQVGSQAEGYGYGINLEQINNNTILGHLGGYYGIRGELHWYKDSDYIISILANSDQTDYIDLSYFISTELTGTLEKKEAYSNTLALLSKIDQYDLQNLKKLTQGEYDETLIQIKAYHLFNKQDYQAAYKLFYLNRTLFHDSMSAQNDLKMSERSIKK